MAKQVKTVKTVRERLHIDCRYRNPFTQEGSPILFKAKGRLIPSWGFDATGLTSVLPEPWEKRSEQMDEIELIPMGAARLRISAFPPEGISEK